MTMMGERGGGRDGGGGLEDRDIERMEAEGRLAALEAGRGGLEGSMEDFDVLVGGLGRHGRPGGCGWIEGDGMAADSRAPVTGLVRLQNKKKQKNLFEFLP